jgi:carbon-monoxide dehydrogenase large subunit
VSVGGGSHSGRALRLASIVMLNASREIIAKGLKIASHLLEADANDLEFVDGRFTVKGTDRALGIFEVAAEALRRNDLSNDLRGPLYAASDETVNIASFPYGCHVCEVEVDAETGVVELARYTAVDDVGRAVNPLILHGQTHGGIAQGVGQALLEASHYDPESGQLLAASFMDYAVPRADTLPFFATALSEIPAVQPTRRPFRRGRRYNASAGRGDQRHRRCAGRARSPPYRNAGNTRAGVARHSCSKRSRCGNPRFPLRQRPGSV